MPRKKSTEPASPPAPANVGAADVARRIHSLRGLSVILDADLAEFFGTTTTALNQYRSRNEARFTPDYAFQLTEEEWEGLISQIVISNAQGRGGRRKLPWAYTEHGVAMMSMGMRNETAIRLSKVIIETFIDFRRGTLPAARVLSGPETARRRRELAEQIHVSMTEVLKLPLTPQETVGEALGSIAATALSSVKALLKTPELKADRISAEAAKILAETEKLYAEARRIHEETNAVAIRNKRESLALLRELRDMAAQLERDEWAETFDHAFGDHALGEGRPMRRLMTPEK
jgi:hypothetical protein